MTMEDLAALAPSQFRVMTYICAHLDMHGVPPTQQQIANAVGVSQPNALKLLNSLQKRGFVSRERYGRGSLRILNAA